MAEVMGCNNRKVAVFIENVMLMNELVQERVEVICRKRPSIRCIEQKIVNICGIQVGTRANCILLLPEQAVEYTLNFSVHRENVLRVQWNMKGRFLLFFLNLL